MLLPFKTKAPLESVQLGSPQPRGAAIMARVVQSWPRAQGHGAPVGALRAPTWPWPQVHGLCLQVPLHFGSLSSDLMGLGFAWSRGKEWQHFE